MRNLQFHRRWRVIKSLDEVTVALFSRAANDEGEFVAKQRLTKFSPYTKDDLRRMRSIVLGEVLAEEAAFARGEGAPVIPRRSPTGYYWNRRRSQKIVNEKHFHDWLEPSYRRISFDEFAGVGAL